MQFTAITLVGPAGAVDLRIPSDAPVASWMARAVELCGGGSAPGPGGWTVGLLGGAPIPPAKSLTDAGILDGASLFLGDGSGSAQLRPLPPAVEAPPPAPRHAAMTVDVVAAGLAPTAVLALLGLPVGVALGHAAAATVALASGLEALVLLAGAAAARRSLPGLVRESLAVPVSPLAGAAVAALLAGSVAPAVAVIVGSVVAFIVALPVALLGAGRLALAWAALAPLVAVVAAVSLTGAPVLYLDAVVCALFVIAIRFLDPVSAALSGLYRAFEATPGDPSVPDPARVRTAAAAWLAVGLGLGLLPLAVSAVALAPIGAVTIAMVALLEVTSLDRLRDGAGIVVAAGIGLTLSLLAGTLQLAAAGNTWQAVCLAGGGGVGLLLDAAVLLSGRSPRR